MWTCSAFAELVLDLAETLHGVAVAQVEELAPGNRFLETFSCLVP